MLEVDKQAMTLKYYIINKTSLCNYNGELYLWKCIRK